MGPSHGYGYGLFPALKQLHYSFGVGKGEQKSLTSMIMIISSYVCYMSIASLSLEMAHL